MRSLGWGLHDEVSALLKRGAMGTLSVVLQVRVQTREREGLSANTNRPHLGPGLHLPGLGEINSV